MDAERRELRRGGLFARDGFIVRVGPDETLPRTADTVLDLSGRRLAVREGGRLSLHDTGAHRIRGVSQRQGAVGSLLFSTDGGAVRLPDLPLVDTANRTRPQQAPSPPSGTAADAPAAGMPEPAAPSSGTKGGDPLTIIERLAELHAKGILTAEEFAAKKAELLSRL